MSSTSPSSTPHAALSEAVTSSLPTSWQYTAEGGANLVLSYAGPPSPLSGKVLRLRKRKKHGSVMAGETDLRFAEEIIQPLLGAEQVLEMERVSVQKEFLVGLKAMLHQSGVRPEEREREDEVDESAGVVVLTEDLVRGKGVLAIEIKPKWGFLPDPTFLSEETRSLKTTYCRFCMHAVFKADAADPEATLKRHQTGYCPLDLYAGTGRRVGTAIDALWEGWQTSGGAANNFRLFLNGERISPSDNGALAAAAQLLGDEAVQPCEAIRAALVPILLASPILPTISRLQSSLDTLDIEGLERLVLRTTSTSSLKDAVSRRLVGDQPDVDEWKTWAANDTQSDTKTTRELVLAYLLSATFKDCSIFIRIKGDDVKVKAIDLDPKPLDRLAKYSALDRDIVESFRAFKESAPIELRKCSQG